MKDRYRAIDINKVKAEDWTHLARFVKLEDGTWGLTRTVAIEDLPAFINVVPAVHAHWEKVGKHDWCCSACKIGVPYSFTGFHYCHNCGAKMDER